MTIVSNPNVYSTAIRVAEKLGWEITTRKLPTSSEQEVYEWNATKGDKEVVGNNPIELLGLIKLYEEQYNGSHEPYWWKLDGEKPWWEYTGQKF